MGLIVVPALDQFGSFKRSLILYVLFLHSCTLCTGTCLAVWEHWPTLWRRTTMWPMTSRWEIPTFVLFPRLYHSFWCVHMSAPSKFTTWCCQNMNTDWFTLDYVLITSFSQNKLRRKMAHLVLVREAKADPRTSESAPEQGSEEHRPLLVVESEPSSSRTEELKELSANYSLIPDASLPAQVRRPSAIYYSLL